VASHCGSTPLPGSEEPKPIAAAGTLRVESHAMVVLQASAE